MSIAQPSVLPSPLWCHSEMLYEELSSTATKLKQCGWGVTAGPAPRISQGGHRTDLPSKEGPAARNPAPPPPGPRTGAYSWGRGSNKPKAANQK